jgi:hypothetical protein
MTPKEKAKAEERSLNGSGPRIVTADTLQRLEREEAPEHLIRAARWAIKTNPV